MRVAVAPAPLYLFDSLSGRMGSSDVAWSPDVRHIATGNFLQYVICITFLHSFI